MRVIGLAVVLAVSLTAQAISLSGDRFQKALAN